MDPIGDVNAPKTLEFWIPDEVVFAILGLISGVFSFTTLVVFGSLDWNSDPISMVVALVCPGGFFAIAAMIPFRGIIAFWWPKLGFAIAISSVAHATALTMVDHFQNLSTGWGAVLGLLTLGALGALIVGKGILVILGHPWRYQTLSIMVVLGAIGGLFGLFAYFVWQPAVAAPLGCLRRELSAGQTGQGQPN